MVPVEAKSAMSPGRVRWPVELVRTARNLRRRPLFTSAFLLLTVLGVGVNTAIFSLLEAVFLHPLPVASPETLVAIYQATRGAGGELSGFSNVSLPNFRDLRDQSRSFSGMAAYQWYRMNLSGGAEASRINGMFVSGSYFDLLGLRPLQGRFFRAEEDRVPGREPVLVLGEGCWRRLFAADPRIVGRTVILNGHRFTVVGIAPRGFRGTEFATNVDAWVPLMMYPVISPVPKLFADRGDLPFRAIGRLRPGIALPAAQAEMSRLAAALEHQFPQDDEKLGLRLLPLVEATILPREREHYVSYGHTLGLAAMLLLAVACANLANLQLSRGLERRRELAIRQAVGADLRALLAVQLNETLLLLLAGGMLSLLVGGWALRALWSFRPPELAGDLDLSLDPGVFGLTMLVVLSTVVAFGIVPTLRWARQAPSRHLGSTRSPDPRRGRWHPRRVVLVVQLAVTLLALIGTGLLLGALQEARHLNLGFRPQPLVVLTVSPGDQGYDEGRGRQYYRRVMDLAAALPGVRSAALSENRLLRGAVHSRPVRIEEQPKDLEDHGRGAHRVDVVSAGFFRTAGIPLLRGRDFGDIDCAACPPVAIVNETMARLAWPGREALGRRFSFGAGEPWVTVVGVARDAKYRYVHEDPQLFLYLPLSQVYVSSMTLHVEAAGSPPALVNTLRTTVQAVDPGLPLADVDTMANFVNGALWLERAATLVFGLFGAFALITSVVGLYSVVSLSVQQRRRDFGIRIALGARRGEIIGGILAEVALLTASGLALGLLAAWWALGPILGSQVQGVALHDLRTYTLQALTLLAAALVAGLLPARRAGAVEPARLLREE
jgi:predicted permease